MAHFYPRLLLGFALLSAVGERQTWAEKPGDELPALVEPDNLPSLDARHRTDFHRMGLGVNYQGAQLRWNLSRRWSVEARYQGGKAGSNYGDVTAQVEGLRLYRFFHERNRFSLYVAPEVAHVSAKPVSSSYKTDGFAAGVVGGFDYRMAKRLSLAIDLGPYVISLKESQTKLTQTNLDFVLNTAILLHLF